MSGLMGYLLGRPFDQLETARNEMDFKDLGCTGYSKIWWMERILSQWKYLRADMRVPLPGDLFWNVEQTIY